MDIKIPEIDNKRCCTFEIVDNKKLEGVTVHGMRFSLPLGQSIINFAETKYIEFLDKILLKYVFDTIKLGECSQETFQEVCSFCRINHIEDRLIPVDNLTEIKWFPTIIEHILFEVYPFYSSVHSNFQLKDEAVSTLFLIIKNASHKIMESENEKVVLNYFDFKKIISKLCNKDVDDMEIDDYYKQRSCSDYFDFNFSFDLMLELKNFKYKNAYDIKPLLSTLDEIDTFDIHPLSRLLGQQALAQKWLYSVLDIEATDYKDLNIKQRIYLGMPLLRNISNVLVHPNINYTCKLKKSTYDGESAKKIEATLQDICTDSILIDNIKNYEFELYETYNTFLISGMLYIEMIKMAQNNIVIKKCKNCDKYFIVENMNNEYCDRIELGETKPCSEIGSNRSFAKKMEEDKALKAYNQAYKTHYARRKNSKGKKSMSQPEFYQWYLEAKAKLEQARSGNLSLEEFQSWLKK